MICGQAIAIDKLVTVYGQRINNTIVNKNMLSYRWVCGMSLFHHGMMLTEMFKS